MKPRIEGAPAIIWILLMPASAHADVKAPDLKAGKVHIAQFSVKIISLTGSVLGENQQA
ncbi:MAG: hypothetical protein JXR75_02770 [Rhodobacteraceae bacterium]|nr:hypothetical protein [Paracoccaceae bacterium]